MSELEKAIDQKLADARKASEGAESTEKVEEVKIKKEPGTEGDGDKKKVEEAGKGKEDPKSKKEEPAKKVASGSASSKKDEPKKSADEKKDGQSSRSGGDRKDDSRKVSSSGDSRRTSGSDRRDDHRRGYDRRDDSSRSYRSRREEDDRRRGTSNRDRDEPSRNGTKSSRGDDGKKDSKPNEKKDSKPEEKKDEITDKTKDDKSKDSDKVDAQTEVKKDPEQPEGTPTEGAAAKPKKKKNKRPKVTINDGVEWDITRDFGTSTDDIGAVAVKQEPPEEWQVLSEDHENDKEPSAEKETRTSPDKEKRNSQEKERPASKDKDKPSSKDKEKRSRDRSPTPPWSTRHKSVRGRGNRYQSDRRSPPRRRSRSREVSRRRSRSPVRNRSRSPRYRRSPSTYARSYRAPSRRYSPPRRSRSPVRRRSRSRSRLSSDRGANPKALLAKKSFLDDLAVKFAQEGKEFPELEQYRCEINSQFGSGSSYMPRSLEHVPGCGVGAYAPPPPPGMGMSMGMGGGSMYDMSYSMGAPEYVESPPLVGYPIVSPAPAKPSPPTMIPLEDIMASMKGTSGPSSSIETIMPENQVAVSDLLMSQASNLGSQPEPALEKGFVWRGDVKTRVSQAIELLDDMEHSVQRSGKFMYRSQTYYENNIDENRSPMLQGPNNPRYAFNAPPGECNDPFGNIPKNIKPVIKTLCLDEGRISEHIFLRTRKQQLAATLKKKKQEMDERKKRAMASNVPKAQLQKTTQTDPTVCTECLIRKLKFRATAETQTAPILTTDSVVQTNPMPVQTVSEFGSITELTPNQVRAVSELIRYIKLTATTGSVEEMRNSMLTKQMYSVNSDLRNAYQYFDAMVEHKNNRIVPAPPSAAPQQILEAIDEPPIEDIIYEDDNDGTNEENWDDDVDDEYEKYHKTFGGDSEHAAAGGGRGQMFGQPPSSAPAQYQDPKSSFQNNPLAPYSYAGTMQHAGGGLRGRGGGTAAAGRGKFTQPRGGRGRGGGKKNARGGHPKPANWK
ncbi:serine/arginine repetitive matrix protein 1 [Culex quinquefasciatus]|uniref:serine/arginine repetitive matrix protein 1 n=1 Tax=Culex quinquefasciatus TaxID=7176 RepID=UPI0018E33184|nr:serine/arginine repetitive matrix protein 1 [Culex quinquefasciatus]XP_038116557.1 serine/arginine repetitive matrix protein 1 [Culex quinquefasciatus]